MVTLSSIETLMTEAIVALDAGDYPTAERKALACQGRLALLPDSERSGGSGGGDQKLSWIRQSINDFITNVRRMSSAAGGVRVSNVEVNPVGVLGDEASNALDLGGY